MPDLQLKRLRYNYNLSALISVFAEIINIKLKITIEKISKEKHSLTRKLVGYRNWRQRWCKKERNKILGKGK